MLSTKIFTVIISTLSTYSQVAIIEPALPKNHCSVSNTVDSRGASRFSGVATSDVSSCSVFLFFFFNFVQEEGYKKLATEIFDFFVLIFSLCIYVYLSSPSGEMRLGGEASE